MNLIYAEVKEVFSEGGMRMGKVRIGGAMKRIYLDLLTDVQGGDTILLCDGVALSKVEECTQIRKQANDVSGNTR
jgi:hydrogenase maturation factor